MQGEVIKHLRELLAQCPASMQVVTGTVGRSRTKIVIRYDEQDSAPTAVFNFITKLVAAAPVVLAEWRERSPYDTFPDVKVQEYPHTARVMSCKHRWHPMVGSPGNQRCCDCGLEANEKARLGLPPLENDDEEECCGDSGEEP